MTSPTGAHSPRDSSDPNESVVAASPFPWDALNRATRANAFVGLGARDLVCGTKRALGGLIAAASGAPFEVELTLLEGTVEWSTTRAAIGEREPDPGGYFAIVSPSLSGPHTLLRLGRALCSALLENPFGGPNPDHGGPLAEMEQAALDDLILRALSVSEADSPTRLLSQSGNSRRDVQALFRRNEQLFAVQLEVRARSQHDSQAVERLGVIELIGPMAAARSWSEPCTTHAPPVEAWADTLEWRLLLGEVTLGREAAAGLRAGDIAFPFAPWSLVTSPAPRDLLAPKHTGPPNPVRADEDADSSAAQQDDTDPTQETTLPLPGLLTAAANGPGLLLDVHAHDSTWYGRSRGVVPGPTHTPNTMTHPPPKPATSTPTLDDVLANAEITLHFELAARTLRASDVARLANGDLIDLGVGVGEPILIKAGGVVVGEGELVELEGNVGVRVVRLSRDADDILTSDEA